MRGAVIGACGAGIALSLRYALIPFLGDTGALVTLLPGVLLATLFGGALGGLTCLGLSLAGVWILFLGSLDAEPNGLRGGAVMIASLASGAVVAAVTVMLRELIFRLEAAKAREHLLVLELQHRVKNNLLVIQSLAKQTLRASSDLGSFEAAFGARLLALGAAQNLLSQSASDIVDLNDVVQQTLAPFEAQGRLTIKGQAVEIRTQQAISVTLCLHELATNATKHGALRPGDGRVEVDWLLSFNTDALVVVLKWRETGVADIQSPRREGFGFRLLRRGVDPGARQ